MSYSALRDTLGSDGFERVLFEGRGHLDCWMGESVTAPGDVCETVRRHIEAVLVEGPDRISRREGMRVVVCGNGTRVTQSHGNVAALV